MQTNNRGDEVMTTLVCRKKSLYYRPNTDHFFSKKDQIQTASHENTDQNFKCHSEKCKSAKRDTVLNMIVQRVYVDIITVESNPSYKIFVNINKGV